MDNSSSHPFIKENVDIIKDIYAHPDKATTKEEIKYNKDSFISTLHTKYNTSTNVVKSEIIDSFIEHDNIIYLIKHLKIDNTKSKPILINQKQYNDPFAPPINEDMLITDDFLSLNYHRVMLTKFPLFANQLLLVSREFHSQYSHLTFENIRDCILLNNIIDGFGFFNGGMKAGASQPRKHLQCVPYSSLPKQNIALFDYINKGNDLSLLLSIENICSIYSMNILDRVGKKNIMVKFTDDFSELIKKGDTKVFDIVYRLYITIMKMLIGVDVEKEKEIKSDYSFLLNDKFMFVVMRKENEVYISEKDKENGLFINLNSLAFYFIIVSRTQEQIDEMKQGDIIKDVLSKL